MMVVNAGEGRYGTRSSSRLGEDDALSRARVSGIDDVLHAPDERHRARALPRVQRVRVDGAHLHVSKQRALKGGQFVGGEFEIVLVVARLVVAAATVPTAAATASTEPIVSSTVTIVEIFAKSVLIAPAASSASSTLRRAHARRRAHDAIGADHHSRFRRRARRARHRARDDDDGFPRAGRRRGRRRHRRRHLDRSSVGFESQTVGDDSRERAGERRRPRGETRAIVVLKIQCRVSIARARCARARRRARACAAR